jgi:hypothetical protein
MQTGLVTPGYWEAEAPIPVPREHNVVIAYGDYLYVLGGYGSEGSSYRYDPLSDTWTQLATPDSELEFLEDGCLGYNYRGEPIIAIFPNVYSDYDTMLFYNILHDWWGWGHPPGGGSTFFDIASDPEHNVCYITGGQAAFMPENRFYAYYPATNTIEQLPSFTTGRHRHASWFIPQWGEAGYVCIAGGYSTTLFTLNSTQCYDIAQGVWRAENVDLGILPYDEWGLVADALKFVEGVPQLWLLGGVIGRGETNETAYYDVEQGAWVAGPHLPYAITGAEADTLGNEIYMVGGNGDYRSTAYNQHHIQKPLPTCTEESVFFDDFEGEQQWTPSGYNGLWHAEPQDGVCGALVAPFPSPSTAWYYGDQIYGCTYDTPTNNYGYLTLDMTIPITGARYANVRFWSYEQTECGDGNLDCNDYRRLDVSYDGGATWTHLWWGTTEERWYTATETTHVDPGDSLRLRFNFTTYNTAGANDYLGWFIDNVEVTGCFEQPTQTWFEEDDPAIAYTGPWKPLACAECSGGAQKAAAQRGATAEFTFTGTGIRWYLTKANLLGKARVYLDGVDLGFVDLYSPTPQYQQVWEKTDLSPGAHTLKIEVSGKKNPRSKGRAITLDALEVVP